MGFSGRGPYGSSDDGGRSRGDVMFPSVARKNSFEYMHAEYLDWVRRTFPDETSAEQWEHFKKEIKELLDSPKDASEYADVLMMLLCVARNNNIDILRAFREKLDVNKARTWERTEEGIRHVEESTLDKIFKKAGEAITRIQKGEAPRRRQVELSENHFTVVTDDLQKGKWVCRRCKTDVIDRKCQCKDSPSPWDFVDKNGKSLL